MARKKIPLQIAGKRAFKALGAKPIMYGWTCRNCGNINTDGTKCGKLSCGAKMTAKQRANLKKKNYDFTDYY